jgi:hypothetical protein
MRAETTSKQFSERLLRQVRLDARRALAAGLYCVDRSVIERLECVDCQDESETRFGRQLWYFQGTGVNERDQVLPIFGAMEYSLEYGLNEPVQDAVFDSSAQRERFHAVYRRESLQPSWRHPAHRWLLAGVALLSGLTIAVFYVLRVAP